MPAGLLWADAVDGAPSATPALVEDEIVRPRDAHPAGWRGLVRRIRGAHGTDVRLWDARVERCRQPAPGGRRIAVLSRKGGVGKTTAALMIGHTLAAVREDRVLAIDGNPDAGTLGHRVRRQTTATVADALDAVGALHGYPDVRRLTSQAPSRLEVLASPEDPHASRAMSGQDYQRIMDELHRHYPVLLCDTGTGILDDATQGILAAVDQVVLVTGPAMDSARASAATLDWLDGNGHAGLVADAVVVVNAIDVPSRVDMDRLVGHFDGRARAVHVVPHDRHLEVGAITDPDQLSAASQTAWLDVAASVADAFAHPTPRDARGGSQ